jgi:Spy/CpxP family protein refolding chaperone
MRKAITQRAIRLALFSLLATLCLLAIPGALLAQGPRPLGSWWERPWWNSSLAQDLNLTDAQKTDINGIVKDYRTKMMDLRGTVEKADKDVAAAFGESPVDQRKANEAIERLAAARGDLTRTLSQMSLKLRVVLTADQWQSLQQRGLESRSGRGKGRGRREDDARQVPPPPPPSAAKQ